MSKLKVFQWIVLAFSLFLIVIGCLSFYDGSNNSNCSNTNMHLVVIGTITVLLAVLLLFLIIHILKQSPDIISNGFCYIVVTMISFGISIGTVAILNGVDTLSLANQDGNYSLKLKIGWFIECATLSIGIFGTLWTILSLLKIYNIQPFDSVPNWI